MDRALTVELLGGPTPVVRPEDLVLSKLLVEVDRGYDEADAISVIEEVGAALDRRYLSGMALRLGVRGRLRRLGV